MEAQENKTQNKYRNEGLKPCPFCGETERISLMHGRFGDSFVTCFVCHVTTAFFTGSANKDGDRIAKDAWNMRREPVYVIREDE